MAVRRIDLTPAEIETVHRILTKHVPGREIWVFGSRARGGAKEFSDLDLAIVGDARLSLARLAALQGEFEESALRFKVDLVDWGAVSDSFRELIREEGIVFSPDEGGS